jgi:cell division protein FtsB
MAKKNVNDTTLRNLHAQKKLNAVLKARVTNLKADVRLLQRQVKELQRIAFHGK